MTTMTNRMDMRAAHVEAARPWARRVPVVTKESRSFVLHILRTG